MYDKHRKKRCAVIGTFLFNTSCGIKLCILYMSHDKDDVHIISTEMVQKVQKNAQIHIVVWYNMRKEFCMLF